MLVDDAISRFDINSVTISSDENDYNNPLMAVADDERLFGHLAWKPPSTTTSSNSDDVVTTTSPFSSSPLVGAIGCAAQVLIKEGVAKGGDQQNNNQRELSRPASDDGEEDTFRLLCRGSYRFIVREVIKTFPYPVAIVDELVDDDPNNTVAERTKETKDDQNDDLFDNMDSPELVHRIFVGLQTHLELKLKESPLTPLELSILEENGVTDIDPATQNIEAEEMAAVLDILQSSLVDLLPSTKERYYTIAMMAAELAEMNNEIRAKILCMRNGIERLRVVLEELEQIIAMSRARVVATEVTNKVNEPFKELKVGSPELPPWSRQIKKGFRISYYWNEDFGWCNGEVIEDPVLVVDELLMTVRFDDGEVHRLPFQADEKVRWKPGQ